MKKYAVFISVFFLFAIFNFDVFSKSCWNIPKQSELKVVVPEKKQNSDFESIAPKIEPLKAVEGKTFNKAIMLENSPRNLTVYHYADGWWPGATLYWWNESSSSWQSVSKSFDYNDGYVNWMVYNVTFPKMPVYVYFHSWWAGNDDNGGDLYYLSDIDVSLDNKTFVFDGFIYSKNPNYQSYVWFSKSLYWYAYTVWADEIVQLDQNKYEFKGNVNFYGTSDGENFQPVLKYKLDYAVISYDSSAARLKVINAEFRQPSGFGLPYFIQDGRIRGLLFDVDGNKIITGDNSVTLTAFTPGDPNSTPEVSGIRASLLDSSRKTMILKGRQNSSLKQIEMDYQGYLNSFADASGRNSITIGGVTFTADYIEIDDCGHYHLAGSVTCSAGSFVFNDLEIIYFDETKRITLASGTLNVGVAEITIRNVVIDAMTGFVVVGGGTLRIPEIQLPEARLTDIVADFSWEGFHCRGKIENSLGMLYVEFDISSDGAVSNIIAASNISFTFENTAVSAQWFADFGNGHYSIGGNANIEGINFNFENLDFVYNDQEHTLTLGRGEIKFPNSIFATVSNVVYNLETHEVTFGQLTVGVEEFQIAEGIAAGLVGDFYPDHLHLYGRLNQSNVAFQLQFDLSYDGQISNLTIGAQLSSIQIGNLIISCDAYITPQAGVYIFSGNVQIQGYGFTFNQLQITYNNTQHTVYLNYGELRIPYFTATVQNVLINADTGEIIDGSGKVNLNSFKIGNYEIASLTASFDKQFLEVDGSIGIPGIVSTISGIRIHFRIDWKGNIYSIGGGVIGEIPILDTGVSLYDIYIQVDNKNGFIEDGGLNRTGWVIMLYGTIAPSGGLTYTIADDFQLIVEPSSKKFTLNGILKVGGNPVANSTLMAEPGHLFANSYTTIRLGGNGEFEVHADAWLEYWKDDSTGSLRRSGAGSGYISYYSNRIVNSSFEIDQEKLFGQATVSILNDWIDFCVTYQLYDSGTVNLNWGCPQLPPAVDPCGSSDLYPSCVGGLIAESKDGYIKLYWTAAKDDKGISYYRIFKNGSPYGVVYNSTLSFTDNLVEQGQVYTYEVHPLDTAYQEQTGCNAITVKAGASDITLLLHKDESGKIVLSWDGWTLPEYTVYRGPSPQNLEEVIRTPLNEIYDPKTPEGNSFYVIQQIDK